MADNRVGYGLAKKYGIDTSSMSPKEVWEALRKKGITEENVSDGAYDSKSDGVKERAKALIDTDSLLSKQEYAIWSKKLADELHGGYVKNLPSGEKVISTKNKVVFSKGTFESPKILKVIKFDNALELELFMGLL